MVCTLFNKWLYYPQKSLGVFLILLALNKCRLNFLLDLPFFNNSRRDLQNRKLYFARLGGNVRGFGES